MEDESAGGGVASNGQVPPPPPAKPPRNPNRLRAAVSFPVLSTPGAGPSNQPLPLPLTSLVPLPPVSRPVSSLSLSASQASSRRPSTASSVTSARSSGVATPHSFDTLSHIVGEHDTLLVPPLPQTPMEQQQPVGQPTAKRTHALIELLTSERVYASDLAVMRHVHIPLALGQSPQIHLPSDDAASAPAIPPSTKPPMTTEDARVIFSNIEQLAIFADSFAERIEASIGDALASAEPDSADVATDQSKDTIGALFLEVVPIMKQLYLVYITRQPLAQSRLTQLTTSGPPATPSVGANGTYSTTNSSRHGTMSPEMKVYLATTRALTERHTNAWDLPSLLIKPVQRLLKYPLLLQTLVQSTQATNPAHPDLPSLIKAKDALDTIARDVNEARRRWEIVKAVLDGYGFGPALAVAGTEEQSEKTGHSRPSVPTPQSSGSASSTIQPNGSSKSISTFARSITGSSARSASDSSSKKRPASAGGRATSGGPSTSFAFGSRSRSNTATAPRAGGEDIIPNPLTKIQSLKTKLKTSMTPTNFSNPAAAEEAKVAIRELSNWETRLKQAETALRDFFSHVAVDWSRSVRDALGTIGAWSVRFGRVIEDRPSASNDAVAMIVELLKGLLVVWTDLDQTLQSTLHPLLTSLLGSLSRPLTLVQHAIALHPLHLQHLSTPYAKSRSPYLLSSSKTFLALQSQLRLEMPTYLTLFDKGFSAVVIKAASLQARFWEECSQRWSHYAASVGVSNTAHSPFPLTPEDGATISLPGHLVSRRASAHSSSVSSTHRHSAALSTGQSGDSASSSDGSAVGLFTERWEAVERTMRELTFLQTLKRGRSSGMSNLSVNAPRSADNARLSTTSSLLAATYDLVGYPSGVPSLSHSDRAALAESSSSRHRSDTVSSATHPSRSSSAIVVSPASTRTSGLESPTSPQRAWNAATAFETPSSVNGPPLTIEQRAKKERKKAEKAEREAAIKLVQERAKAEKAASKAARKNSAGSAGSSVSSAFFPGLIGGSLLSPALPRTSVSSSIHVDEAPKRKGSQSQSTRSGSTGQSVPHPTDAHLADRTRDVLFGLLPSSGSEPKTPALPTLKQMSPLALSPPASSPFHHPYAVGPGPLDRPPVSPRSPGEHGLWDSLFDASQQSYKFQPQHSPGTPSPISKYRDTHENMFPLRAPELTSSASLPVPRRHTRTLSNPHPPSQAVRFEEEQQTVHAGIPSSYDDRVRYPQAYEPLYIVSCVHPFHPPQVTHLGLPFLHLEINDVIDVLREEGHPLAHKGLPIYVDDGDDCMLVGRDERDNVGWCLASFVMPLGG